MVTAVRAVVNSTASSFPSLARISCVPQSAMTQSPPLISDEYRKLQEELHRKPSYGVMSMHYAPLVAEMMAAVGAKELLDYGAGKGRLANSLEEILGRPVMVHHYEPAIREWSQPPEPCEFVACIDVLEHIEPELLDNVLDDLKRVTIGTGLFTVDCGPAAKVLGDGRNAHLIQQAPEWWLPKFMTRFELQNFARLERGFWIAVTPKGGHA